MTAATKTFIWTQKEFGKRKRNEDEEDGEEDGDLATSYYKYSRLDIQNSLSQQDQGFKCHFTPFCSSLPPNTRNIILDTTYYHAHNAIEDYLLPFCWIFICVKFMILTFP